MSIYSASLDPISKAEEISLAKQAAAGNKKARETLIRANIRYALSYAKTFYGHGLSNDEVDEEAVDFFFLRSLFSHATSESISSFGHFSDDG